MSIIKYFFPRSSSCKDLEPIDLVKMIKEDGTDNIKATSCLFEKYFFLVKDMQKKFWKLKWEEGAILQAYSETIMTAAKQMQAGKPEDLNKIESWLRSIFNKKCIDLLPKDPTNNNKIEGESTTTISSYEKVVPLNNYDSHNTDPIVNPEDSLIKKEKKIGQKQFRKQALNTIRSSIDALSKKCKGVLKDQWSGFSMREIADRHNYRDEKTAKQSAYMCRKNLGEQLETNGLSYQKLKAVFGEEVLIVVGKELEKE